MPGSVSLGTVHVSLEMRLQQLKEGVRQAKGEISGLQRDIRRSSESMRRDLSDLGRTLSIGVTAPMLYLGKQAVDTAARLDSLNMGIRAVDGQATDLGKTLNKLNELAKLPGLGLEQVREGYINLRAAGLQAELATETMMAFGNALATVGKGKEALDGVNYAIVQLANRTSGFGQEVRQLQNWLPQIRAAMMSVFGTADSEAIANSGITGLQFVQMITEEFRKLPQVAIGAKENINNFNDSLKRLNEAIGNIAMPTLIKWMQDLSPKIEDATDWFNKLGSSSKEALTHFAIGGAIMGPAILGLSALSGWFVRISASPFFQWLIKAGKAGGLGPGFIGATLESLKNAWPTGAPLPFMEAPGGENLINPAEQARMKRQWEAAQKKANEEIRLRGVPPTSPFPFGVPPARVNIGPYIGTGKSLLGGVLGEIPPGYKADPLTGLILPKGALPGLGGMGVVPRKTVAQIAAEKKAAEKAAKERAKQALYAKGYSIDAQIEELRATGHPFRAELLVARKEYNETLKKGGAAVREDAYKVYVAKQKEIWNQYYEWQAARIDKMRAKENAIYDEQLKMEKNKRDAFEASLETVKSGLASLRTGAPVLGLGPSSLVSAAAYAAAKAGRLGPGMTPGTLAPAQVQQGKDFMQVMEQLADVDKGRQLDKLMKSQKAPEGFLGLDKDLAQQMKPKVEPFTFELGRVLGDNLAQEMGREFGAEFDKVFGTKNPLFRALSRTFSRLVDDLLYSVIQRGIGNRLLISLFGSAGGGAAGGAMSTASAAAFGASSAAKGGAAKAAGISAGQAWTAGFYIAAAWGLSRVLNSIFRGTPQGRANLQGQFAARPGMQAQAMGLMNFSGMPVVVNFHGANFNGKDDPRRVASSVAWHVANQMRVRPGS